MLKMYRKEVCTMKIKRFLAIGLTVLLIATLFSGCGAASYDSAPKESASSIDHESLTDSASGNTESIAPPGQKLIRTLYLNAETEDMDAIVPGIEEKTAELGGYIEGREVYNGSAYGGSRYRHASLTIRIPAEKLDAFVNHVADASNITSNRETTEDVTLSYVATESRVKALETEQTRLLELLAKAETMEDLLLIESRLTEVRTELEEVTSQLRLYDNLVNYGTIYLELEEVVEYTEPRPDTVWSRIGKGFVKSLKGVGNFFVELFVFLIVASPYLALIAVIVFAIIFLIKRKKKKKAAKKAA